MEPPTYEDQFGAAARRLLRLCRPLRRLARRAAGMSLEVLVETRWRLGDEVMAIPIYEALKHAHPRCRVTALCNYPELLDESPFVDAVNNVRRDPDLYACLRSGPRLVPRIEHYARCAGVAVPGFRPKLYYTKWDTEFLRGVKRPFAAICPGGSWPTKRWPAERWRALGAALRDLGCDIVELGVQGESVGAGHNFAGATSVREAACILHASRLAVCCDSGLMHLALAAGTPVLALFGPTDPDILVRGEPRLTALTAERDCHGCWNREGGAAEPGRCPLNRPDCLDVITADTVVARARALIEQEGN